MNTHLRDFFKPGMVTIDHAKLRNPRGEKYYRGKTVAMGRMRLTKRTFRRALEAELYTYAMLDRYRRLLEARIEDAAL